MIIQAEKTNDAHFQSSGHLLDNKETLNRQSRSTIEPKKPQSAGETLEAIGIKTLPQNTTHASIMVVKQQG
jgi:hypothetical protein